MKKTVWSRDGKFFCNGVEMNECKVCGNLWVKRTQNPKKCPKCQSIKWSGGGPYRSYRSYSLSNVEIGDVKIIAWNMKNGISDELQNKKMNRAINMYAKRNGMKFSRQGTIHGLILTRIK